MSAARAILSCLTLLTVIACGDDSDAPAPTTAPGQATQKPPASAGAGASSAAAGTSGSAANSGTSSSARAGTNAATPSSAAGTVASAAGSGVQNSSAAGSGGSAGADAGSNAPAAGSGGAAGTGSAGGAGTLPPPPTPAKPSWARCGSNECATLKVPLDYADPTGKTIDLALSRRAARGQRIGALFINPGGPGGSAVDFLSSFLSIASPQLLERFDIVAFDPRGVGKSTPLDCHSTLQKFIATDPSPDDEAEWTASDQAATAFADECANKYKDLLPHLATPNVARDMDQVRAAIGDDKLSYLGFSYGTAIGAWYAELFPDRVRALVLDGAVNLQLSAIDLSLEQAKGFERSLASYFDWCGQASGNCSWASSGTPEQAYQQLSAAVDAKPVPVRMGDRPVGPGEFLLGVLAPLYSGTSGFRAISSALRSAQTGDGSALLSIADSYLDRASDGSYGNINEANNAVNCLDTPVPSYDMLRGMQMHFETEAPIFGLPLLTGMFVCAHWPVKGMPTTPPKGKGAPPIVVIGTVGDPATPYAWAQALASELESGVLLTYQGEGHTAYGRSVPCIQNAVDAYLLQEKVPAAGTSCAVASSATAPFMSPSMLTPRSLR